MRYFSVVLLRITIITLLWVGLQAPLRAQSLVPSPTVTPTLSDSLYYQRRFLSSAIYQYGTPLSHSLLRSLLRKDTLSLRLYRWGRATRPVGPLLAVSGIALGYVAVKGRPESATIRYNQQIITAHYTVRSRPMLVGSLALLVAGLSMIEYSSELTLRSVARFNASLRKPVTATAGASLYVGHLGGVNFGAALRF